MAAPVHDQPNPGLLPAVIAGQPAALQNDTAGLNAFIGTPQFQALPADAREFLQRYQAIRNGLEAGAIITPADLKAATRITDRDRGDGAGAIGDVAVENYLSGFDLCNLITNRPYLLLHLTNGEFILLKNNNVGNTHIASQNLSTLKLNTGLFEPLTVQEYQNLIGTHDPDDVQERHIPGSGTLNEDDLIALFNKDLTFTLDRIPTRQPVYTPHAVAPDERFYHEHQHEGLCTIHAVNQFLGGSYVVPSRIKAFYEQHDAGVQVAGVENLPTGTFLLEDGSDFTQIIPYIKTQALPINIDSLTSGLIRRNDSDEIVFEHPIHGEIVLTPEFFATRDRILFTPRLNHCEALRKDTAGNWHIIDSEKEFQTIVDPIAHIRKKLHSAAGQPLSLGCL